MRAVSRKTLVLAGNHTLALPWHGRIRAFKRARSHDAYDKHDLAWHNVAWHDR